MQWQEWTFEYHEKKKKTVLWYVMPCDLVELYRRFRDAYCLHHQGDPYQPIWRNFRASQHHENLKSHFPWEVNWMRTEDDWSVSDCPVSTATRLWHSAHIACTLLHTCMAARWRIKYYGKIFCIQKHISVKFITYSYVFSNSNIGNCVIWISVRSFVRACVCVYVCVCVCVNKTLTPLFACGLFNDAFSVASNERKDDRWMMNWKEFGRKRSWRNLRYYPGICLVGLRNPQKFPVMIARFRAEIWTRDLQNTRQEY
jgi:hypothetical protein